MVNLAEQIKVLVELQDLDTQILKLDGDLSAIPEKIGQMETEFKEKSAHLKKLEEALKVIQVKRKEREGDLEAKENTIKKYQSQLYQLKTNKEYSAMQEEIARVRADSSIIEEDILKFFDQIDAENKEIAAEKDFLKKQEGVLSEEKKKLNEEAGRIKIELDKYRKQRAELAAKVESTLLAKYERILNSKDGLAVVKISQDSCQGCFRIMPPQVINEVKIKKDIVFCENCTRILYVED